MKSSLRALLLTTTLILLPNSAAAMPQAIPIIAAAATSFGASATPLVIFGVKLTGFAAFGVRAALGLALNALSPKPKQPSFGNQASTLGRGYRVTASGSALDHQIIYGETRVAGARVFDSSTGADNTFLHRVVVFAGHEVEEFAEVYLNDYLLTVNLTTGAVTSATNGNETTSRFNSNVRIIARNGTDDQEAIPEMVAEIPEWTAAHRLRGLAYLYIRLQFSQDVFPNGVPEITATIKGRKVYDPRTLTTAWSDNPALCLRDYLTQDFGLQSPDSEVDDVVIAAAANICDETVEGETRYTCSGAFLTDAAPADVLDNMLTSMGGLLWHAQGAWRMKPAYYATPVLTLDEGDLRSGLKVQTRVPRRDNFNTVRGVWRGPESNWQETDYAPVSETAFVTADGGVERAADVNLPFATSHLAAQRIARIALRQQREQVTISGTFGLRAFAVQVGDVVQINNSRLGWVNKTFEVVRWTFGLTDDMALEVQMSLRETSADVYTDVPGEVFEQNNTTLISPYDVPPPGITLDTALRVINEQVAGVLIISLTGGNSGFRERFEVEYKPSAEPDWIFVGSSDDRRFEVPLIADGLYDVRARSVNTLGVRGPYNTVENWFAAPFAEPPATVQNFTGNVVGNSLHLTWDAVPDLDLSHYKIRYASETSGAEYQNAVDLVLKVARPGVAVTVPARTGTYFIKAVDKLGNVSTAASSFVVSTNIVQVENLNVVETVVESPDFAGATDGVVRTEDDGAPYITLDTSNLFDSATGDFDDAPGLFDGGGTGGAVASSGTYQFDNIVDLGEVYTSRVQVDLETLFLDYVNTFDSVDGLFDARLGTFDGDPSQFDLTSVVAQVSYTDDDPLGTPAWSAWQNVSVSDITARAFRFRVVLSTQSTAAAPAVTMLSATVDMPDRLEAESDITYTGSRVVTFPVAFKVTPSIGIAATLADGDRYAITAKSRSGFTITTFTGASVSVNPTTFDYVAKGYGREVP